jgi:GAF domain-containing protein
MRGFISLSSRDVEYILAEAGKTLSLQQDDDKKDMLWDGVGSFPVKNRIGPRLLELLCNEDPTLSHLIINDLTKDDRFKDELMVMEAPHVRFVASVPLCTVYKSINIGTYVVVDDKPRDGLTDDETQFLKDMAITVVDYLEAGRIKQKESRGEQMVKALGLFVEGKQR